ncbi:MAG: hypothetical protein JNM33_11960 [Rubrivivax sp.]|nr:hypothetical protein [Rubrivivax sp.]
MTTETRCENEALCLALRFELTLDPAGPRPAWQAELRGTRPEDSLHFGSMGELIRYLARLDLQVPPPRGIR